MNSIRVLVANRPRLIRELVIATISEQPDIEIVGEIPRESDIVRAVENTHPDFLIVALEKCDRMPDLCRTVLQSYPHIRVIAIAPDRNSSMFYQASLSIEANQIEASEDGVLRALRAGARPIAGPVRYQ
ncbi:MAG: hypothetical protein ACRD4S_06810 [Candidatus Acidiferrales bacterium]